MTTSQEADFTGNSSVFVLLQTLFLVFFFSSSFAIGFVHNFVLGTTFYLISIAIAFKLSTFLINNLKMHAES